jgi:hypothetical protein
MDQPIVIQDLDEATAAWISAEAKRRGLSVEAVVHEIIHKGIKAVQGNSQLQAYHDLDWMFGTWTDEEAEEFLKSMEDFELRLWTESR